MTGPGRPGVEPRTPRLVDAAALLAHAQRDAADAPFAPRTRQIANEQQAAFTAWCTARGVTALPAAPESLAAWLTSLAHPSSEPGSERPARALATVQLARTGVDIAHRRAGLTSPAADPRLRAVMAGIARSGLRRPRQQPPALRSTVAALAAVPAPPPDLLTLRDQAFLALSYATRLPPLILASIPVAEVLVQPDAIVLPLNGGTLTVAARTDDLLDPHRAVAELLKALPSSTGLLLGVVSARSARGGPARLPTTLGGTDPKTIDTVVRALTRRLRPLGWTVTGQRMPRIPVDPARRTLLHARVHRGLTQHLRDRALLLTAWHLALRPGETGLLTMDGTHRDDRGFTLWLPRAKNDAIGHGSPLSLLPTADPILDPVTAMDAWLAVRGPAPGAIFCLTGPGSVSPGAAIPPRQLTTTIQRLAALAALDGDLHFTGQSLRIGAVVQSLRDRATVAEVMTLTRHRDPNMVGSYGRGDRGREQARARSDRLLGRES
jgi:hypothetical protein